MSVSSAGLKMAARSALGAISPDTQRIGLHALAFTGVIAGGAATGYIAAGDTRGALTGALVHVGLFGVVGAILGSDGRLTMPERIVYGSIGLGGAIGAGYLWMSRR
jgi:uncharacterized membrane protein YuzA (DUF378 family)